MVQPNYSPKEALEKMKLLMKYDTSKTLNENVKTINEQSPTQVLGAGAGAAFTTLGAGATLGATLGTTLGAVGSAVPIVGTAAGIAIGYGLGTLIDWMANKDLGSEGFKQVMQACSAAGVSKLIPKLSKAEVRQIAYTIEKSKGQWNDDEDAIEGALTKIPTIADLCAVDKKVPGGLYEFLDSLTDSPNEWRMFTRPLEGMIEDTEMTVTPEEKEKVVKKEGGSSSSSSGGGGSKKTKYTSCPETFPIAQTCKNNKIKEIQACLNMPTKYQTGNFGPITQGYLVKAGVSGTEITQDSYDKVCSGKDGSNKLTQDVDDIETLGNNSSVSTTSVASNNTQSSVESGIN